MSRMDGIVQGIVSEIEIEIDRLTRPLPDSRYLEVLQQVRSLIDSSIAAKQEDMQREGYEG